MAEEIVLKLRPKEGGRFDNPRGWLTWHPFWRKRDLEKALYLEMSENGDLPKKDTQGLYTVIIADLAKLTHIKEVLIAGFNLTIVSESIRPTQAVS